MMNGGELLCVSCSWVNYWELGDEGSTASPLSAPVWSCLLNYTSVQPLSLFSIPSSLHNLIRESADAVHARLMWNQFKATHKNLVSLLLFLSLSLSLSQTHTHMEGVVCAIRDGETPPPLLVTICLYESQQGAAADESWCFLKLCWTPVLFTKSTE